MAKENSLEAKYTRQLQELGVYRTAFDPEIKTLCQVEREYRALDKEWRKTKDYTSKLYDRRTALRREILEHRDSLGLTPKGFKRLKPETVSGQTGSGGHPYEDLLAELERKCAQYE